jgi:hypothetical protein
LRTRSTQGGSSAGQPPGKFYGQRERIVRQIAAQRAERHVGKNESGAIVDVGGVDPDLGQAAPGHVLEGRAAEQMSIEPTRESSGVVDAAAQALRQIEEAQIGL